jgi:hypothetical protein
MYVNEKTITVETVPGIRGGRMKGSSWGGEFKYGKLIHCNNFVNATIKKEKEWSDI